MCIPWSTVFSKAANPSTPCGVLVLATPHCQEVVFGRKSAVSIFFHTKNTPNGETEYFFRVSIPQNQWQSMSAKLSIQLSYTLLRAGRHRDLPPLD